MTNQQGAPEALRLADEITASGQFTNLHTLDAAAAMLRRLHAENERLAALVGAQQPAPSDAAADPMDWPLPCDVTVGHGTMCKGVSLRTLVTRMKVLYEMATGNNADEVANRTPEQRTALFEAFRVKVGAAPQPSPTPQADSQPAPAAQPAPMSQPSRLVAYSAAAKLGELGYEWSEKSESWAAAPHPAPADAEDAARSLFDAGWKACARFCDRDDVAFDGIVGNTGCPQFEEAFAAARKQGGA